ncbi:ribonuclease III [bacterium]|nr:MAG: ribonuclease III [bacterium]
MSTTCPTSRARRRWTWRSPTRSASAATTPSSRSASCGSTVAGEQHRRRLRALARRLEIPAEQLPLLERAFVHASALSGNAGPGDSNERLEFLGDSVLGLVAADYLERTYPLASEGELSKRKARLVSGELLAMSARRLRLGELLVLGASAAATGGGAQRPSLLADAFEALVAALYRARGLAAAAAFIEREHLTRVSEEQLREGNAKTALQEWTTAHFKCLPVYAGSVEGPPHARTFTASVNVGERALGSGTGRSKRAAQQAAAAQALEILRHEAADEQEV